MNHKNMCDAQHVMGHIWTTACIQDRLPPCALLTRLLMDAFKNEFACASIPLNERVGHKPHKGFHATNQQEMTICVSSLLPPVPPLGPATNTSSPRPNELS